MTRNILLLSVFLLAVSPSSAQSFEGEIIYENKYTSKTPTMTDQQFNSMMGTTQEYFIKGGNYKSVTTGTFVQWQLYINKDNKLYSKMSNNQAILWNDAAVYPDEVLKSEINKNAIDILGHSCDELILTCKSGIQKYYFSNKLTVDKKLFEKHKFGNWSEYISKSGALPLKMIIDLPQFKIECVAKEIKPSTLDDKLFELPTGSTLQKSPY